MTFDGVTAADTAAETIDLGQPVRYGTGDAVVYQHGSGGEDIGGLSEGATYYVIRVPGDGSKIKLAASAADAQAGKAVDLTAAGQGHAHSLTETVSTYAATATSGGGGTEVGVAGSLALNVALIDTHAELQADSSLNAGGGDVTLTGTAVTSSTVTAVPTEAGGATGSDIGVGASIGINVVQMDTTALVGDGAALRGAKDVALQARGSAVTSTTAKNGASGGTAVAALVALTVGMNDVEASLGTGADLECTGSLVVSATGSDTGSTLTRGETKGATAVGVALSILVALDHVTATTHRNVNAGGPVTITASGVSGAKSEAYASAAGAKAAASEEGGSGDQQNVDQQVAGNLDVANEQSSKQGGKPADKSKTPSAKTSDGTVAVGAAVSVNVVESSTRAFIPDGIHVTSGGLFTLHSSANTGATAAADGSANLGSTSVGIAVALNVALVTNEATVGAGAVIVSQGAAITADMAEVSGDTVATYGASAVSGAGGTGKVPFESSAVLIRRQPPPSRFRRWARESVALRDALGLLGTIGRYRPLVRPARQARRCP
jgi:hypothetical protein